MLKLKIAITGGIGCGKSTALRFLEVNGINCLSTDTVVKKLLSENQKVIDSVVDYFGTEIKNEVGYVDRSALAKIVFQSKSHLEWLESLLHPLVQESCDAFFETKNAQLACVEIPLLFEKRLEKRYDLVVAVVCSEENAKLRLRSKGFLDKDIAFRRQHQLPNSIKAKQSNFVLSNDGSLNFLEQQIITLLSTLKY